MRSDFWYDFHWVNWKGSNYVLDQGGEVGEEGLCKARILSVSLSLEFKGLS